MNPTPTHPEGQEELDRLFSEFFKTQLKHPWPNAPVPASGAAKPAEPSELVTARASEPPRSVQAPTRRDHSARARLTLAASVALMLGACWYLSNGFAPGSRTPVGPNQGNVPGMLRDSGAHDQEGVLPKVREIKAIEGAPKIDMDKFE